MLIYSGFVIFFQPENITLYYPTAIYILILITSIISDQYDKKNLILSVKSGLTGLAQVSGRADMPFEERRKLDLYYVQNWSFWGDIVILIKTVWVVFARRGTR